MTSPRSSRGWRPGLPCPRTAWDCSRCQHGSWEVGVTDGGIEALLLHRESRNSNPSPPCPQAVVFCCRMVALPGKALESGPGLGLRGGQSSKL